MNKNECMFLVALIAALGLTRHIVYGDRHKEFPPVQYAADLGDHHRIEPVPDGIYEVTYVVAEYRNSAPRFRFGMHRPSVGGDEVDAISTDFNFKDCAWFETGSVVRVDNGKDITVFGPKHYHLPKSFVSHNNPDPD